MSYVINSDEKILYKKTFFQRIKILFKKLSKKIKNKIQKIKNFFVKNNSIDSIDNDNNSEEILCIPIETIDNNNIFEEELLSKIKIDCLEFNEELVKISPFLKTILTPQEIYTRIVPRILNCFELYWKVKKLVAKIGLKFLPKNKKEITELLNLKFDNDYNEVEKEHKIHKFVNLIIADTLLDNFKEEYFTKVFQKKLNMDGKKKFLDLSLLKYTSLEQNFRYNFMARLNLTAFLHNIYYGYLSKRYKKARFKDARSLFKLNFYIKDARKSILEIKEQYDYMFLDAFTYSSAPELWTTEFISELYKRLAPTGLLMTYSNSALVRNTLLENNFYVGKIYNEKTGKFIGTVAAKEKSLIKYPLSNYEIGLCSTKAGIPYHDPNLNWDREIILKRREYEFKNSDLLSSSAYQKSRNIRNN
jgi:hypothetical protein